MSGTSLDGVDAVLSWQSADVDAMPAGPCSDMDDDPRSGAGSTQHVHLPMPSDLRDALLALNRSGNDEIHRAALAANALMVLYADAVSQLLRLSDLTATAIDAIGAHGQTVRHRPGEFDGFGYTVQLVNGSLLAELTGIDVICDFRSRDVAAGGQGAPLVPAFHDACFSEPGRDVAVLNLGGIANLSLLHADGRVAGFDTGPGNVLLDLWCQRHLRRAYDAGGAWAAGGSVVAALLSQWLTSEPYFEQPPPKSSGRDRFNAEWLDSRVIAGQHRAQDVMATLTELTARTVATELTRQAPRTSRLLVCGGGVGNRHLMSRLQDLLTPTVAVCSTAARGLPPDQVEALAFAWLAAEHQARRPGNRPAVTGASGLRVLGARYPASCGRL